MNRIIAWLCEEANTAAIRDARGGDEDTSVEGRLRREVQRARVDMFREAIRCLRALPRPAPGEVMPLAAFLRDPSDELVVAVLDAFAGWSATDVLPDLLALLGAPSLHERPAVEAALARCLRALTGRSFASATALAAWMQGQRSAA